MCLAATAVAAVTSKRARYIVRRRVGAATHSLWCVERPTIEQSTDINSPQRKIYKCQCHFQCIFCPLFRWTFHKFSVVPQQLQQQHKKGTKNGDIGSVRMGSTDFSAAAAVVRRIVCFIGIVVFTVSIWLLIARKPPFHIIDGLGCMRPRRTKLVHCLQAHAFEI